MGPVLPVELKLKVATLVPAPDRPKVVARRRGEPNAGPLTQPRMPKERSISWVFPTPPKQEPQPVARACYGDHPFCFGDEDLCPTGFLAIFNVIIYIDYELFYDKYMKIRQRE